MLCVIELSTGSQSCWGQSVLLITARLALYQAAKPYSSAHVTVSSSICLWWSLSLLCELSAIHAFSPQRHQIVTAQLASWGETVTQSIQLANPSNSSLIRALSSNTFYTDVIHFLFLGSKSAECFFFSTSCHSVRDTKERKQKLKYITKLFTILDNRRLVSLSSLTVFIYLC